MAVAAPFVLLDDARRENAAEARLYRSPSQIFVARRADEVEKALAAAEAARRETGHTLAGYLSYEAGLALEPRLRDMADTSIGAGGPLVWLGLFDGWQTFAPDAVPEWLERQVTTQGISSLGPLDPQISHGEYAARFERLQQAIRHGDIYQANLTFPLAGSWRGDPLTIYAALRAESQAGYGGVIFDGSDWLLSLSPELFVSVKGEIARARPMKGTRARGETPQQDEALADDLRASVKDRAENLMIVDLMRNDLSRVAMPGSVRVEQPFTVETYPTLHQLVSTVEAKLRPDATVMELLRAMFPCGSITGAPKIRAMELITATERDARGVYCGAIGRIGGAADGSGDEAAFNVAIRTLRLTPVENAQGRAVLGVGSAIVADSEAPPEWREALLKGDFARRAAPGFDLLETMRFDPDEGIALLELHLERMKHSADTLGFSFDRHATRNAIQALCFELENPARLRLMLARSGATSLEASALPEPLAGPARCIVLPLPVDSGDFRLRHKTTDRHFWEDALAVARANDAAEALITRDDGLLTEGSFTSLFVERGGTLHTPPAHLGLLPGVQRRALIESGRAVESELRLEDLEGGFWIGNALRGLMKAELA